MFAISYCHPISDLRLIHLVPTLSTQFVKRSGCYINAPFNGGIFDPSLQYGAQSCAQLCINDGCCKSFVSGYGLNLFACNLAYISSMSDPQLFVCDPQKLFDYYEKLCSFFARFFNEHNSFRFSFFADVLQFYFPGSSFASISASQPSFSSQVYSAIFSVTGAPVYGNYSVQLNQTALGEILVSLSLPYLDLQVSLVNAISAGTFSFVFNKNLYTASFSNTYGLCAAGSISRNGYAPNCITCPSNTYVCFFPS